VDVFFISAMGEDMVDTGYLNYGQIVKYGYESSPAVCLNLYGED
jgi:hypothetical protein